MTAIESRIDDAAQFLEAILPGSGVKYLVLRQDHGWVHKPYCNIAEMAAAAVKFDSASVGDVYFACAAYKEEKSTAPGQTKPRYRVKDNQLCAKALWVDIDCGANKAGSGDGYATQEDAKLAVQNFLETTHFPEPLVVNSGNGLHCYWPLASEVSVEEWCEMAATLKQVLSKHGVVADPTRTADFASILRPVGTRNKKDVDHPKPVCISSQPNTTYDVTLLKAMLANLAEVQKVRSTSAITAQCGLFDQANKVQTQGGRASLNDSARAASALAAIPADITYPEWRNAIWAFKDVMGEDGKGIAHEWSASCAEQFDPAVFEKLWASDKVRERGIAAGTLYAMAKRHGWNDPRLPHLGQGNTGKSPIYQTLNDAGNADRLIAAADGNLKYCVDVQAWLVWKDGHWHWDTKGHMVDFAIGVMRSIFDEAKNATDHEDVTRLSRHASASLSDKNIRAALRLAQAHPEVAVHVNQLDADPFLIGVRNGVIDIRTGTFREARPEDLITRRLGVAYDPGAKCPVWETTLKSVFKENLDVVEFVQRAAGYSITGDTREQVFFFLHGSGSNGKSTVLNALREISGSYGLQTQPEVLMARSNVNASGPTPEIARLAGPRFVCANETEEGQRMAESTVKQLTGGDAVTARVLHGMPFDFVPKFKLWLAGNHRPIIRGDDHGIWRRMRMIGFNRQFSGSEIDKDLPEKLRAEYPGILNWLIDGARAWMRSGLNPPAEIVRQTEAYRSDMDLMQQWLDECCLIQPGANMMAGAAYTNFCNWLRDNGHRLISNQKFAEKLKDRGFEKRRTKTGAIYSGLSFRQEVLAL